MPKLRFIGLDVHAETIAVAVAEAGGKVRSLGIIPNRLEAVRKIIAKLGPVNQLRTCYGRSRIRAVLATHHTRGGLPSGGADTGAGKSWLSKFVLRHGHHQPTGMKAWEATLSDYFHEIEHTAARIERLGKALDEVIRQAPEQIRAVIEALQALRGVAQLTAATIVSEIGNFSRFKPRKLMGYSGLVASEHSSGNRLQRGSINKTGNAHSEKGNRGKRRGLIKDIPGWAAICSEDSGISSSAMKSKRSPGRRSTGCISDTTSSLRAAKIRLGCMGAGSSRMRRRRQDTRRSI